MLREKKITIQDRNGELDFKIREMSAVKLESWVMRAILLLASAGSDIPANKGIEGAATYLANHGLEALGKIDFDKAKPLLDEMLEACAFRIVDRLEEAVTPQTAEAYIGDIKTLFTLRKECLAINLNFFGNGSQQSTPERASTVRLNAR